MGIGPHLDYNRFLAVLEPIAEQAGVKLTAKRLKLLQSGLGRKDPTAMAVFRKVHKPGKAEVNPIRGRFAAMVDGKPRVVEYEPDSELRDTENVPLKDDIAAYFAREVLPHVPDAWMDRSKDKVGYEISFTKYFYEYTPLRSTAAIAAELLQLDEETENLLREIAKG